MVAAPHAAAQSMEQRTDIDEASLCYAPTQTGQQTSHPENPTKLVRGDQENRSESRSIKPGLWLPCLLVDRG